MTPRAAPPVLSPHALVWIEQRLGLDFPAERALELARQLVAAAAEADVDLDTVFAGSPANTPASPTESRFLQSLARRLTVGETYFFREPATLDAIERHVLPGLIRHRARGRRRLRLWSAGCCTGEEAYTLAMILERALPDIDDWDVRILATDINRDFLQRAERGLYRDWSFRQTPAEIKTRFFTEIEPGVFAVHPRLRARVSFVPLNLVDDHCPSPVRDTGEMDLILCRNVLMYFSERQAAAVIARLRRSLADSGWLALSPAEHALRDAPGFRSVNVGGGSLYQKTRYNARRPAASAVAASPPLARSVAPAAAPPFVPPAPRPSAPPRRPFPARSPAPSASAPDDPATRARTAADRGELPIALRNCEQALAADRMNPDLHGLRARILEELGRPQEAAEELRRVLYLSPDSLHAHFALGNLASRQGASAEARRAFSRLLALLRPFPAETELPEMEGLTAGRLAESVRTLAPDAS